MSVIRGDARALPLPDASVDAVVTDPPYGLRFMGRRWDYDVPGVDVWGEAMRVLKPGGRLLAFAGTRTMHRMWCAIEDAGFTIEDTIAWMFGSGFPKHRSKLKPAYEPICVARKGGVTPLNIDACRIGTGEGGGRDGEASAERRYTDRGANGFAPLPSPRGGDAAGRWPANVVLDERAADLLDAQAGERPSGDGGPAIEANTGGAARFFYCAKASREERNAGLEGLPERDVQKLNPSGIARRRAEAGIGRGRNHHPTVKPVDLMRWLVRLVTPPGGLVLDPFTGSGTTGVACTLEGFRFIGIEREAEYVEIARRRIAATQPSLFSALGGAA